MMKMKAAAALNKEDGEHPEKKESKLLMLIEKQKEN